MLIKKENQKMFFPAFSMRSSPLKPHTSLHSISDVLIWGYKEACPRKGETTGFNTPREHKDTLSFPQRKSSGNNWLNNG